MNFILSQLNPHQSRRLRCFQLPTVRYYSKQGILWRNCISINMTCENNPQGCNSTPTFCIRCSLKLQHINVLHYERCQCRKATIAIAIVQYTVVFSKFECQKCSRKRFTSIAVDSVWMWWKTEFDYKSFTHTVPRPSTAPRRFQLDFWSWISLRVSSSASVTQFTTTLGSCWRTFTCERGLGLGFRVYENY